MAPGLINDDSGLTYGSGLQSQTQIGAAGLWGTTYLPQTVTLIAAMSPQPDSTRAALINTLIGSLVSAGVWPSLDCLYVMAAAARQPGRLNWKDPSRFNLTEVDAGNLTFTTDRGFAGNGSSSYLDSLYDGEQSGTVMSQDSAHVGVWSLTAAQEAAFCIGNTNNAISPRNTSNLMGIRGSSGTTNTVANSNGAGHFAFSRSAGSGYSAFIDASATAITQASAVPNTRDFYVCAWGAASPQYSTRQLAVAHWGASLTSTQMNALYAALGTYLAAVGAT